MSTSAENAMASNHFSEQREDELNEQNEHDTSAASTAEPRQDIERTRARMSGTIDTLQAKLAPTTTARLGTRFDLAKRRPAGNANAGARGHGPDACR